MRTACAVLTGLLLTAPLARAGNDNLAGTWKVTVLDSGTLLDFWLVKLEPKDGKLDGSVVATAKQLGTSTLENPRLKGQNLTFTIKLRGRPFDFEGLVPKGGKVIRGTLGVNGRALPVELTPTKAETVEAAFPNRPPTPPTFEQERELLAKEPASPKVFTGIGVLFRKAKENKATAEDVKGWRDALLKSAALYGPRWQRQVGLEVASALADAEGYPEIAEEMVRQAIKAIDPKDGIDGELRGLSLLQKVLKQAGKNDELKKVTTRIDKLELEGHKEALKNLPFTPEKAPKRAAKDNRVVVVELFTGAMCPPCVAADMAFDGLEKTYPESDVVLLQYHLHIPGPDALTNPAAIGRQKYYAGGVRGTPSIFFNGKSAAGGGGSREHAEGKYKEYLEVVKPLLMKSTDVKITASAARKGDKIEITASVDGLDKPGENVKLRLALVEDWVRYLGSNGLPYHSRVVRAMPGGAKGFALKDAMKQTATVDLGELRKNLNDYLDTVGARFPLRPMRFHDLHVVAYVQDDDSKEILQAIDVPVSGGKD